MSTFKRFIAIALIVLLAVPSTAFAQETEVEVSHGGWAAVGGTAIWMVTAPFMQLAVNQILSPDDPEICDITPARCEPSFLDYTLAGLVVLGTLGLTAGAGWGTAKLTEALDVDPTYGWGGAGGIVGIPIFGMLYLSLPKWEPKWANTTVGTIFTFAGSIGSGFYFADIATRRGHAWPEFGFGFGGVLLGAGAGSLVCGGESCFAVPLLGAIGGILGVGLSTLIWGVEPDPAASTEMMLEATQQPLIHYSLEF